MAWGFFLWLGLEKDETESGPEEGWPRAGRKGQGWARTVVAGNRRKGVILRNAGNEVSRAC